MAQNKPSTHLGEKNKTAPHRYAFCSAETISQVGSIITQDRDTDTSSDHYNYLLDPQLALAMHIWTAESRKDVSYGGREKAADFSNWTWWM